LGEWFLGIQILDENKPKKKKTTTFEVLNLIPISTH